MFLQICIPESDTHVHRFLWRNLDTTKEPTVFAMQRVSFGDKPSPDMASFVMLRMADEHKQDCQHAATVLRRDRYMDDLIHSCPSAEVAAQSIKELDEVLATGSFKIKEWICSSEDLRNQLSIATESARETPKTSVVNLDGEEEGTKILGVGWNPQTDMLSFASKEIKLERLTKRSILSSISKLYDPLGLASAVTIKARIALQDIWRSKQFDWDDILPDDTSSTWKKLFDEIERLKSVQIPRCVRPSDVSGPSELHVFADASGAAFGAVAYLLCPTSQGPEVRLVSAKAKVAPLRQSTIPRLELMAALIASRLAQTIYTEFKIKPATVTLWSDSTIVLHWLWSETATLKTFVGVRVAEIQSTWAPSCWKHVPTEQNVADDLSRGISVRELSEGRWLNGPSFLKKPKTEWPSENISVVNEDSEKKSVASATPVTKSVPLVEPSEYSSWGKLKRVIAYCLRFVNNLKSSLKDPAGIQKGPLQPEEMDASEDYWIRESQRDLKIADYPNLSPFIQDGIIRVGSRLNKSQLPYDQVNPVLLPANCHISTLIMRHMHQRVSHAGRERTLCESRARYWIVRGRSLAKKIARECVTCRKIRQRSIHTPR
ncbi:hypothetical protein QZH41_000195 [Actinostola sp. cb2023]|nr:hypothetical protein QZH41_000195 [Actinostola sp. cb2023]